MASSSVRMASAGRRSARRGRSCARARLRQLVQRGQVDGAQRGDLLLDAVDLGLQAPQLDGAVLDRAPARPGRRRRRQLLQVLRATQLRGLGFQLQLGDLLAQRVQAALELQALLVGRRAAWRSGRRTRCGWRPGPVRVRLQRQRRLQAGLRGGVVEAGPAPAPAAARPARWPFDLRARSRWRAAARRAGRPAPGPGSALPAPGAPARAAARGHRPAGARRRSPRLPARRGAPGSGPAAGPAPRSALRRWRGALPASSSWRVDLGQFVFQLAARASVASACCVRRSSSTCSWWARVCASAGLAPRRQQALRGVGVGGLGAHRGAARLVGDQRLRTALAVEVLDLLRPRQHAGLLGIGRVEATANCAPHGLRGS
jgi:hypothetical protein